MDFHCVEASTAGRVTAGLPVYAAADVHHAAGQVCVHMLLNSIPMSLSLGLC